MATYHIENFKQAREMASAISAFLENKNNLAKLESVAGWELRERARHSAYNLADILSYVNEDGSAIEVLDDIEGGSV